MDPLIDWTTDELMREWRVCRWEGSYWAKQRMLRIQRILDGRANEPAPLTRTERFTGSYADSFAA